MNLLDSVDENFKFTVYTGGQKINAQSNIDRKVNYLHRKNEPLLARIYRRLFNKRNFDKYYPLKTFLKEYSQDYLLLNTLVSLNFVDEKILLEQKIILYVHETESMLVHLSQQKLKLVLEKVDLILCSSNAVKSFFSTLGRNTNIEVLYPAVNFSEFNLPINKVDIRREIGFDHTHFIWGMSGALLINKNPKSFIQAAIKTIEKHPHARFLWIGATGNNAYEDYLRSYLKQNNLDQHIVLLGRKKADYFQYLNCIDAFLLTSLSESYSLAAMEAAAFNKPVVSFPCGGVLESVPESFRKIATNFSDDELVVLMEIQMNEKRKNLNLTDINFIVKNEQNMIAKRFTDLCQLEN